MSAFAVPKVHQHRVLLFGILIALVLRGGFIIVGAAVISRFSWVFYLFGAFLVLTAIKVVFSGDEDDEYRENAALRLVRRVLPVTDDFVGTRSVVRRPRPGSTGGRARLMVTPMLLVMLTIGVTDLLFALDSIPAVFGLTRDPYIVFTANVFALMGLRQLYFLLGGLLRSLVYLSYGLGVILAFIGVKLVLEALHTNTLPFLNDGRPLAVPVIGIELSLAVIVGVLLITTVASLVKVRFFPRATPTHGAEPQVRRDQQATPDAASSATDTAPSAVPRT
jgi:tellurite resistance protein TerC